MQIEPRQCPVPTSLANACDPLLAKIYANRGIDSPEQIDYGLKHLTPFAQLKDISTACQIIGDAIIHDRSIVIVGDYDCDGATSTSLAYLALNAMGANRVSYYMPDRFAHGYGLSVSLVTALVAEYDVLPQVIVTVDNGIASHAGVDRAHAHGMKVVVTDHHLPGDALPNADSIVNPNQSTCNFPHKSTAGVGVVFYVMCALRGHLRDLGWFEQQQLPLPNMAQFLDLVALGTVADLVPLDYNNRILVAQGVSRIRQGLARPGILALIAAAQRRHQDLQATDLGFVLGPRLNAAGRLQDISVGIECLITQAEDTAATLAQELDQLNRQRRSIESTMQVQAEAIVAELAQEQSSNLPACICLFHERWHEGVVGIVASRIKEKWHRPAIIFAQGDDGLLKGSARSVAGFHIRDALAAIDASSPNLITRFGGHAMAAGLSMPVRSLAAFERALKTYTDAYLDPQLLQPKWRTDGSLPASQMQLQQAHLLGQAGPWGQGFSQPLFHGEFGIVQQRIVGEKHLKLVLAHNENGELFDGISFNVDLNAWPTQHSDVQIVYRLDVNQFRGKESVQLLIEALWALPDGASGTKKIS